MGRAVVPRRPCHELGCNLTHPPAHLLGGETCAWGTVINADNFRHYAWVGTAAVAERLWARDAVNNLEQQGFQMEQARRSRRNPPLPCPRTPSRPPMTTI